MKKTAGLSGQLARSVLLAGSLALPLAPQAAQAAGAGASANDEIIVTARHRAENVQDVPAAVSVIGGALLEDTNTTNIAQLAQLAPSVQFSAYNPRNSQINIRGFGSAANLANDGIEPGVGFYVDQVYYARPATATFDLIDIDNVQILRGPQGTLYGKNTTAGVVSVSTKAPSFEPGGAIEATAGDYKYGQLKATMTGPVWGDKVAGRLSVGATSRQGLVTNVTDGRRDNNYRNAMVRGQLLFKPSETFSLRLTGDWSQQNTNCCTNVLSDIVTPANGANFVTLSQASGYTPVANPFARTSITNADISARQSTGGASAVAEWNLGPATLTSVTAWRYWDWAPQNDIDSSPLDIFRLGQVTDNQNQYSQEFRIASNGENRFDYVAGVYAFREDLENQGITEYGAQAVRTLVSTLLPGLILNNVRQTTNGELKSTSYAVYGQGTLHVTPRFDLIGGLRYTNDKKDGRFVSTQTGGVPLAGPLAAFLPLRNGFATATSFASSVDESKVSGQAGASWRATDDMLVYATYSRGFKAPGLNLTPLPSLAKTVVAPESIDSIEAGVRSSFLENRLTLNLALFEEKAKDYQANTVDPTTLRTFISNVPELRSRGGELDARLRVSDALAAYTSIAYTDAEYTSFPSGPCGYETNTQSSCDWSHRSVAGVPLWSVSSGGEYTHPLSIGARDAELFVGADYSYRSSMNSTGYSRYTVIDGVSLVNARIGVRAPGQGWTAYVWSKNLTDEDYLSTKFPLFNGALYSTLGDPRTVGVTLRYTK